MANTMRSGVDTKGLISKAFNVFNSQTQETIENSQVKVNNIVYLQDRKNLNINPNTHKETQNTQQATARVLKFSTH